MSIEHQFAQAVIRLNVSVASRSSGIMRDIEISIPRAAIEAVVRDVLVELQPPPAIDAEAQQTHVKLERLMVKKFWSIAELAFVWGCSDGHVRNLIQRAQDGATEHPIPFCNIDGLVMFEVAVILEWTRQARPFKKGSRKSGGKKRPQLGEVQYRKAN